MVETVPKEQEVKEVVYSRPSSITSPCSSLRSSFTDSVSAVSGESMCNVHNISTLNLV